MKTLKYFSIMFMMLIMGISMISCDKDDENAVGDNGSLLEGDYVGTLKPMGYSDEPARAYVTLTRRAKDAVSFTCSCETFEVNTNPVNLTIEDRGNGLMYLTSESTYSVEGTEKNGSLTITFSMGDNEWFFSGMKD